MSARFFLKGSLYRNHFLYKNYFLFKHGWKHDFRLQIAARYIKPAESVVDICSGPGLLKEFIPKNCAYTAIEASRDFIRILKSKGIDHISWDLHKGWPKFVPACDVAVMIISLSQFRKTSVDSLLENFKGAARRVVIVEEVLSRPRNEESLLQRTVNYLCAADYYVPVSWYTSSEFARLMKDHGYQCETVSDRYMIGSYDYASDIDGINP